MLHAAAGHDADACLRLLESVRDPDALLLARDDDARVPLHLAAAAGSSEAAAVLVGFALAYEQLRAQDLRGFTPVQAAAAAGHEEVALLLAAARAREDEAKAAELAGQFE